MNDDYVSRGKVVTLAVWAAVLGLLGAAWAVTLFTSHKEVGGMFAASACACSALAATMQIRCYMVRVMCLVRATSGVRGDDVPAGLRSL